MPWRPHSIHFGGPLIASRGGQLIAELESTTAQRADVIVAMDDTSTQSFSDASVPVDRAVRNLASSEQPPSLSPGQLPATSS